ncbi:cancer-related nucleoside-triphosphatase homolog [Diadema antillarum]|uniref:cancer-related nucleoside-triphosphatase homolog n=1 Tax=Diadema antillarum TaxID=105358 RepID=UPI003A893F94
MASSTNIRHIFLTGPPGIGKTTLVRKACSELGAKSIPTQGFYTEEVRAGGKRIGFDVVTLDGQRGTLAKVGDHKGPKVGQYTVNLPSFEQLALPVVSRKPPGRAISPIFVIDEVGKMELFSQGFIQSVRKLLDQHSSTVLGTIPIPKGRPLGLVEEIRSRPDVKVVTISKDNRDAILGEILDSLHHARSGGLR